MSVVFEAEVRSLRLTLPLFAVSCHEAEHGHNSTFTYGRAEASLHLPDFAHLCLAPKRV